MIDEVQSLLERYSAWLRDKTVLRQVDDWVEMTTPFLDRHNDHLQIYVRRENGSYLLTDDSYTIEDLAQSGCKLESPKRRQLLETTLNGFGVRLDGDRIEVSATADNFALRKHNLVQAMLAVNDLFYLAEPTITSLFLEDVEAWLDHREIRYTPKVKFTGKTGYDHLFDFVVPKSRERPERILQTVNRPSRDSAEAIAFKWIDTREVRPEDSQVYAILNDREREVAAAVTEALRRYDVRPLLWSSREEFAQELAE
jgi:hypothetical protein